MNHSMNVINEHVLYINELRAQLADASAKAQDAWSEAEQARIAIRQLENRIAELEERLAAAHEGAQMRAKRAVDGERQRVLKELSRIGIDPVLFIDVQAIVHNLPKEEEGKETL